MKKFHNLGANVTLIKLPSSCLTAVSVHIAVGWSAVCDCHFLIMGPYLLGYSKLCLFSLTISMQGSAVAQ